MKFVKRPIVVEAEQFDGTIELCERLITIYASNVWPEFGDSRETHMDWTGNLLIDTPEGVRRASPGDWIITEENGDRYPCKPDIFDATYEPLEEKISEFSHLAMLRLD